MNRQRDHIVFSMLGLVVLTTIAFEGVRLNGFVYDDGMYITKNGHVQMGLTSQSLKWAITAPHSGSWHPLTWVTHITDFSLFGLDPAGHHIVNLILHIMTALVLFVVLFQMTSSMWPSLFVALIFAVHPLRVESVAWIAERKDVLSGLFWMLTMLLYARYTRNPRRQVYIVVALGLVLGLLSKPMLVTLPFVLLLLDVWPLQRVATRSNGKRKANSSMPLSRLVAEKIPLIVIALAFAIVTIAVQRSQGAMTMMQSGSLSFVTRIENAVVSYVAYLWKMIYPTNLAVFYPHPGDALPVWQVLVALAILVSITAGVVYGAKKGQRYLLTGWFWYLGTLLPVIGIIQVGGQAMADRYTYVPMIGILIMVVWGIEHVARRWPRTRVVWAASGLAIAVVLVLATRTQVAHWRNSASLYGHALSVTTDNWLAHYNLGRDDLLNNRVESGIDHMEATLRIVPDSHDAHNNLGAALNALGRYDEAIEHFKAAVEISPESALAYNNLGQSLGLSGRIDEAVIYFEESVRLNPRYPKAFYNLCFAYAQLGRYDDALEACDAALRVRPGYVEAAQLNASIKRSQGRQ